MSRPSRRAVASSRNHLCFRLGEALTIFSFSSVSCFSISRCPSWTVSVPRHGCERSNRCEGKRISSGTNLPVSWLSPACHRWKTSDERLKRGLMDSKSSLERFSESELRVWQPCQTRCVQDTRLYVPEIRSVVTQLPKRVGTLYTIASSSHPYLSVLGAVVPSYYRILHSSERLNFVVFLAQHTTLALLSPRIIPGPSLMLSSPWPPSHRTLPVAAHHVSHYCSFVVLSPLVCVSQCLLPRTDSI